MPTHATKKVPPQVVDLMIIGAGPTGLTTALLAKSLGLSICICDKAHGPLEFGRADALNARTQEYLSLAGVLQDLIPQSINCDTISTFTGGRFTSRQNHWWRSLKHTHYKSFLIIGQPDIERALITRLAHPILYNNAVVSLTESVDGATTTLSDGTVVRSKYVVGADGARSFVRSRLGIQFQGTTPGIAEAVLDAELDTDFPNNNEIIAFEHDGKARVSWIPRERGLGRFYVLVDGPWTEESVKEDIERHMEPYKIAFKRVEWISSFEVKERIASSFLSPGYGRVLLAGDAAHTSSANGAQGLNTGVADAVAVVWRLHLALKRPELARQALESYELERRGHAKGYVEMASKLIRSTLESADAYVKNIEKNADLITGMGVRYLAGLTQLVVPGEVGGVGAGQRCPDFELQTSTTAVQKESRGETPSLPPRRTFYQHLAYGKFAVLRFNGVEDGGEEFDEEFVNVWDISHPRSKGQGLHGRVGEQNRCAKSGYSDILGWKAGVVVVRPDLYVGYAGTSRVEARQYLQQVLGTTAGIQRAVSKRASFQSFFPGFSLQKALFWMAGMAAGSYGLRWAFAEAVRWARVRS